jgi:LacI family transcriptional regulator
MMKKEPARKSAQAVTTKDIAERTGLSKMTVSRVLNNHQYVSDDTRRKVMAAVRELGFTPNTLAKRFFTGKTRLLGVVIPLEYMFSSFYFKELFQGVLECAEEHGYDMLLNDSTSKRMPPLEKCRSLVKGKLVEGLLLAAPMTYDDYPLALTREAVPLVVTGETACGDKVNRVGISNRECAKDAVQRLAKLGHKRIAVLTFDPKHQESQERLAGYREGMQASGLPVGADLVIPAHYSRREAFAETQRLMKAHRDVTAIFALNEDMAVGAADALRAMGMKIPADVSIVSFDDCAEIENYDPPISAIRQFPYKVGFAACKMLIGMLEGDAKSRKPQALMIETEFMERSSMASAASRRGQG